VDLSEIADGKILQYNAAAGKFQCVTPTSGNPFNQSLDTDDQPSFAALTTSQLLVDGNGDPIQIGDPGFLFNGAYVNVDVVGELVSLSGLGLEVDGAASFNTGLTVNSGGISVGNGDTSSFSGLVAAAGLQSNAGLTCTGLAGITAPNLSLTGAAICKGIGIGSRTVITSGSVAATDGVIYCNATSGAQTQTLLAASSNSNRMLIFFKEDSSGNAVTISRAGSDTINGGTSVQLTSQNQMAIVWAISTTAWAAKIF
jgi:hypothetical protein